MTATEQRDTRTPPPPPKVGSRASQYRAIALRAAPRLLGMLDRDPESPTLGSFDRDHWSWKFRDFPIAMLQTGMVPVALLYADRGAGNPYGGAARMRDWTIAAMRATLARQHRNGAFDSVAPYSQDHGVTLQLVLALTTALRALENDAPDALRDQIAHAVRRACAFAARSEEDYAFISNHQGFFALAWRAAGELLDDRELLQRGAATVDAIIAHQSPDGWYAEYGGPDPGYESLGISYLAAYLTTVGDGHSRLAESLRRSVEFYAHCLQPDGSVGGSYGSRLTQLYYPSGFELLASRNPLAGRIAQFLSERLARGNVVTPDTVDAHNLPSLVQSYLSAAATAAARSDETTDAAQLPCEGGDLWRHFDASGLTVAATPHYYAITNGGRGGITSICGRRSEQLLYEDSGVVIDAAGVIWSSATPASEPRTSALKSPRSVRCVVSCGRAGRVQLTPGKFLLLRILGLTAFRSVALGSFLRRQIVSRLITKRERGPFTCERLLRFEDDRITIEDRVRVATRDGIRGVRLTRGFQPFHMGSARYFHERDLVEMPVVDRSDWTGPTEWTAQSTLRWDAAGGFSQGPGE